MSDWPDWSGQTVVIVGTGPSAGRAPLEIVKGKAKVFAIKSAWKLAPWADALYGIDIGWWIANKGAPAFAGLKLSPSPTVCRLFGIKSVRLRPRAEILTKIVGVVGCGLRTGGGYSGFQAINLAVQFGARRIVLVGFDMTIAAGAHWSKDYAGVAKPNADRVKAWRHSLEQISPQFAALGVDVINASDGSVLGAYPKRSLVDIFGEADGVQNEDRPDQSKFDEGLRQSVISGGVDPSFRRVRWRGDRGGEAAEPVGSR